MHAFDRYQRLNNARFRDISLSELIFQPLLGVTELLIGGGDYDKTKLYRLPLYYPWQKYNLF